MKEARAATALAAAAAAAAAAGPRIRPTQARSSSLPAGFVPGFGALGNPVYSSREQRAAAREQRRRQRAEENQGAQEEEEETWNDRAMAAFWAQNMAQEAEEVYQAQERAALGLEESNPQGGEEEWNEEEAQQQQQEQQQEQEHAPMEENWEWDAHLGPDEEEPEEDNMGISMEALVREAEEIPPRR
jgi:hypothetical protein